MHFDQVMSTTCVLFFKMGEGVSNFELLRTIIMLQKTFDVQLIGVVIVCPPPSSKSIGGRENHPHPSPLIY